MAEGIALHHHERWDGEGYPAGLAGDEIPLGARIVAVADVYDALCHDRPYRRAWSHDRVVEQIEEERGAHFDPTVVDAFLGMLSDDPARKGKASN
jgi:putative two-component system response regulator